MTLWAIVPVKPLCRGKSRLAEVLSQTERTELNRRLLIHTLDILTSIPDIEHVLVISRDQAALALAREHGARTVQEAGAPKLNVALMRATIVAKNYATQGVLIVPADLPFLTGEDVRVLLSYAKQPPVVVVAPDRHHEGTNALLVCPIGIIEYEFGPGSFERHCNKARKAGARLEICELPSLSLDMDFPEDLELMNKSFKEISLEALKESTELK
jgi:2-phospho-L-lactate/phosphoenolpyruvate guanylyltransferase